MLLCTAGSNPLRHAILCQDCAHSPRDRIATSNLDRPELSFGVHLHLRWQQEQIWKWNHQLFYNQDAGLLFLILSSCWKRHASHFTNFAPADRSDIDTVWLPSCNCLYFTFEGFLFCRLIKAVNYKPRPTCYRVVARSLILNMSKLRRHLFWPDLFVRTSEMAKEVGTL